jgi:hypothetical protein
VSWTRPRGVQLRSVETMISDYCQREALKQAERKPATQIDKKFQAAQDERLLTIASQAHAGGARTSPAVIDLTEEAIDLTEEAKAAVERQ